ncbi:MAG: hypothetical protein ACU0CO_03820 [Shimia sp.]
MFLTLSARPPAPDDLFARCDTQPFAPDLRVGDTLAVTLRTDATGTEKTGTPSSGGRERKRHVDLMMDALPPKVQRADARLRITQEVGRARPSRQGTRCGFRATSVAVEHYRAIRALEPLRKKAEDRVFGVLDLTGTLTAPIRGASWTPSPSASDGPRRSGAGRRRSAAHEPAGSAARPSDFDAGRGIAGLRGTGAPTIPTVGRRRTCPPGVCRRGPPVCMGRPEPPSCVDDFAYPREFETVLP